METTKEKNPTPPLGQTNPMGANIPEWVMHLLTGLGTMGAEYMMFIKPLQEKMELQSQLIKQQGQRLEELEKLLPKHRRSKRMTGQDAEEDEADEELFSISRKPAPLPKYSKHARVKL